MPRFTARQLTWRLCSLLQVLAAALALSLELSGAATLTRLEQEAWLGAFLLEALLYYAIRAQLEGLERLHRRYIERFIDSALPPDDEAARH
ncbi:MAG TPA: hypothetical protein VGR98_28015 [Streptosporangiaceae bacterium]|nr:hypothetical protein [Streptosporangiaceae bacterium]